MLSYGYFRAAGREREREGQADRQIDRQTKGQTYKERMGGRGKWEEEVTELKQLEYSFIALLFLSFFSPFVLFFPLDLALPPSSVLFFLPSSSSFFFYYLFFLLYLFFFDVLFLSVFSFFAVQQTDTNPRAALLAKAKLLIQTLAWTNLVVRQEFVHLIPLPSWAGSEHPFM